MLGARAKLMDCGGPGEKARGDARGEASSGIQAKPPTMGGDWMTRVGEAVRTDAAAKAGMRGEMDTGVQLKPAEVPLIAGLAPRFNSTGEGDLDTITWRAGLKALLPSAATKEMPPGGPGEATLGMAMDATGTGEAARAGPWKSEVPLPILGGAPSLVGPPKAQSGLPRCSLEASASGRGDGASVAEGRGLEFDLGVAIKFARPPS